jgi:hypothetical protein
MHFDLGIQGLGILLAISLIFGVAAHLVLRKPRTLWLWIVGAAGWFVGGLIASEVVWGDLTEKDIQPIIDGLAFDESLLGGLMLGVPVVLVAWFVIRRRRAG